MLLFPATLRTRRAGRVRLRRSAAARSIRGNRTSGGEVEATLGAHTAVKMTNVRVRPTRLTARMPGDLAIDYAGGAPYELRFDLIRQENELFGAAITYAVQGRDGPRLPFWVELKRVR